MISMMNLSQVESRMAEIRGLIDQDGADLEALTHEVDLLEARRDELQDRQETRSALMSRIAGGDGQSVRSFPQEGQENRSYGADSPEYRRAFLLELMNRGDEMTPEERAAYVHTTSNTSAVLPTTMIQGIWDLVSKEHCIMDDITVYRTGTIIEVVKHTAIVQGAAATVSENAANDDEKNTFVKVTLSGKDFSKHLDISYALDKMSVDGFQSYLINEIGRNIGEALAGDVITTIKSGTAAGNKIDTAEKDVLTYGDTVAAFALLKRVGGVRLYMNRKTFYTRYVSLVDSTGQPIFQPSIREGEAGTILGCPIRIEESCTDDEIIIGDPSRFVYNMVQDIMVESDRDIKKHVITYSGYCRGDGAVIDDQSFAVLTVKTA
jgi:HK97 family phage major capsid protein